jgi:hypothetical protein
MKSKIFGSLSACLVLAAGVALAGGASDDTGCDVGTLKGTYVFNSKGIQGAKPYAESGQDRYDGKGNVVTLFTNSAGESGTVVGSYSVDANCKGQVTFGRGASKSTFVFYLSPDGDRFSFITINQPPGDFISGEVTRASRRY